MLSVDWCFSLSYLQMAKLQKFGRARMLIKEEEKKDSTSEQADSDDEDVQAGPKANVSLLDQHSRLKQEAEGRYRVVPVSVTSK